MLGAKLKMLRKKHGYTLADVKDRTNLSVSFLSDVERGRTNPSLETLSKLAECYEVSEKILMSNSDDSNESPPGFEDFLSEVEMNDDEINNDFIDLLLSAESRAKNRAKTKEDWRQLYYSLRAILGR